MLTLGLNISGYISAAALVRDDEILAAACEERFSRVKRDRAFPQIAIRDVLQRGGVTLDAMDAIAIAWNPAKNLSRNLGMLREANQNRAKYLAYVPNALAVAFGGDPALDTEQNILGRRVIYVDHHLAHAASACFTSPWTRGAFVTADAFGEEDALTIGKFHDARLDVGQRIRFPHSLGSFYSYLTEFLGFQADSDEYKVMALGAFAEEAESRRLFERLRTTYRLESRDGRLHFELDLARFDHYLFHRAHDFQPLAEVLGLPPRKAGATLEPIHFALAWAQQRCFEEILDTVLDHAHRTTGEAHVALAGGCLMNSVANGKLERPDAPFARVHIPPYPDDSGTAMGAALYVNLQASKGRRPAHRHYRHNFFGPTVSSDQAEAALLQRKLAYRKVDNVPDTIACHVAAGRMVGYVAGAMEFGQRALGHRSIFADPRDPEIRAKLNEHVKNREWFRPYAATILAERVADVFDTAPDFRSDFMEKVRPVRPAWAERIAGILHADQTVRLHTVEPDLQPELDAILRAFERRTGVPLLVNTSFNVAGMPIVCNAADALQCFFACGLDCLLLAGFEVQKASFVVGDSRR